MRLGVSDGGVDGRHQMQLCSFPFSLPSHAPGQASFHTKQFSIPDLAHLADPLRDTSGLQGGGDSPVLKRSEPCDET